MPRRQTVRPRDPSLAGVPKPLPLLRTSILVVDDDDCVRQLLKLHLVHAGYHVRAASDAISAGYMVLESPPDLILCDVTMPHLNGFDFVEALKGDKSIPDIPVIFLTSRDDGEYRARCLGAADYLVKPVLSDQLLSAIARQVRRAALAAAAPV